MRTNINLSVPLTEKQVRGLLECETVFFSPNEEHSLTRPMFHELLAAWLYRRGAQCDCPDCEHAREVERRKETSE